MDRNADSLEKLLKLFKGNMGDYSKMVKILQYICVITSEFNLTRYHLRGVGIRSCEGNLCGGPKVMTEQELKDQ